MSTRTPERMTQSTLPVAAVELTRDPRDARAVRDMKSTRQTDRTQRSERSNDFAGELAAAREAVREPLRMVPSEEEPEIAVENADESSDELVTDHVGATAYRASRDSDSLDPALAAAVDRVIARMREEYGHSVTLVEGTRTPERQAALFAQGRTTPGQVVTWTMASKHLTGSAADLMVDGDWTNMEGYARLQRVAAEEGLKVLGMRDPGHVELPDSQAGKFAARFAAMKPDGTAGSEALRSAAQPDGTASLRAVSAPSRVAEVAAVARVAEPAAVARPAQVAQVASVAAPGVASAYVHQQGGGGGGAGSESRGGSGGNGKNQPAPVSAPLMLDGSADMPTIASYGVDGRVATSQLTDARTPQLVTGAESLDRIAQVEQVKEAAGPRTPTVLTLRVDNGMGGEDRIRLDMRGTSVGATMNVSDSALAERLNASAQELRQALERRGLNADRLHARVPGAELVDASRITAATLDRDAARFSNSQHTPGRTHEEHQARDERGSHGRRDSQDLPNDQQRRQQRHPG